MAISCLLTTSMNCYVGKFVSLTFFSRLFWKSWLLVGHFHKKCLNHLKLNGWPLITLFSPSIIPSLLSMELVPPGGQVQSHFNLFRWVISWPLFLSFRSGVLPLFLDIDLLTVPSADLPISGLILTPNVVWNQGEICCNSIVIHYLKISMYLANELPKRLKRKRQITA